MEGGYKEEGAVRELERPRPEGELTSLVFTRKFLIVSLILRSLVAVETAARLGMKPGFGDLAWPKERHLGLVAFLFNVGYFYLLVSISPLFNRTSSARLTVVPLVFSTVHPAPGTESGR